MLADKLPLVTRKLITSGGTGYVFDGPVGGHSPFAGRLIEKLSSPEARQRGFLTYSMVFSAVQLGRPGAFSGSFSEEDDPGSDFLFVKRP